MITGVIRDILWCMLRASDHCCLSLSNGLEHVEMVPVSSVLLADMNECEQPESVCTEDHQECLNTVGSYRCQCAQGFHEEDGVCVPAATLGKY